MPDRNGSAPSCMPFQLGPTIVTPLPPQSAHRALRLSTSPDASGLQRMIKGASATGTPRPHACSRARRVLFPFDLSGALLPRLPLSLVVRSSQCGVGGAFTIWGGRSAAVGCCPGLLLGMSYIWPQVPSGPYEVHIDLAVAAPATSGLHSGPR
jgi:hypothetical protein